MTNENRDGGGKGEEEIRRLSSPPLRAGGRERDESHRYDDGLKI